jgi:hypothetical protein
LYVCHQNAWVWHVLLSLMRDCSSKTRVTVLTVVSHGKDHITISWSGLFVCLAISFVSETLINWLKPNFQRQFAVCFAEDWSNFAFFHFVPALNGHTPLLLQHSPTPTKPPY